MSDLSMALMNIQLDVHRVYKVLEGEYNRLVEINEASQEIERCLRVLNKCEVNLVTVRNKLERS